MEEISLSFHVARRAAHLGMNVVVIPNALAHSDLKTTQIYLSGFNETLLNKDLDEEGEQVVKEQMDEEEPVIFDNVTQREEIELQPAERKKIKEGVHSLTEKLKQEKLVEDWKKQQRYISDVKVTIEQEFDSILPSMYDRRLFASIVNEVFDHVVQRY